MFWPTRVQFLQFFFWKCSLLWETIRGCHGDWSLRTCSTVSGVEISSPLRIMDRWVRTSASWSEFSPRRSDVRLRAAGTQTPRRQQRCQRRLGWCVHFKTQPTFAKRCLLLISGSHLFNEAGMFCWSRGCLFVFLLHVHPAQSSKTAGGEPAITRSRLHDRLFDNQ